MTRVKRLLGSLRYSLYVVLHPFKGFWDLKHERRGSLPAALTLVALVVLTFIGERQFTGFLFNYHEPSQLNVLTQVTSILLPFALWCVSNWCITTLVEGEGSFTDIVMVSAYALAPLVLLRIPAIVLSNVFSLSEGSFYTVIVTVSVLWTAFLFLIGIMTVHQFSMGKTLLTILIALVGIVIMLFLFILFFALIQQVVNFIILLNKEMAMR